jgi:hypothetical protein
MWHHFMAEKGRRSIWAQIATDRELVRQLVVVYVLGGVKVPPE